MRPRRPGILAAVTAVVLAVTLVAPSAAPVAGGGDAGAADCVWHRHTKRIVKRVRRGGKIRKVVRIVHWWTCDPVPAPAPTTLGVKAFEFYFVLSRPSVSAGELRIELQNRGEDAHNLNLQRLDGGPVASLAETESLERTEGEVSVQPGAYRLWCSLPLHVEKGMETSLLVGPSG